MILNALLTLDEKTQFLSQAADETGGWCLTMTQKHQRLRSRRGRNIMM